MKKTTLIIAVLCIAGIAKAQLGFKTIVNESFESTTATDAPYANGFATDFIQTGQTAWKSEDLKYSGNLWRDLYSNAANNMKNYSVEISTDVKTPIAGINTQSLKINIKDETFPGTDGINNVRIRSNNGIVSFATGESTSKYEVTFLAKTDGATRKAILNGTNDTLAISGEWTKYSLKRYVTGTSATSLAIDFCRQPDQADYVIYIDSFTVAQKPVMTMLAASNVGSSSFTANWTAIAGATSYRLAVQKKVDGTWISAMNAITIAEETASSYELTNLDPNTEYQYRVTATDGLTTTSWPTWIPATTSAATSINEVALKSVIVRNGQVIVTAPAGQTIELYNSLGQREASVISKEGQNTLSAKNKGVHIVKVGNATRKVIL